MNVVIPQSVTNLDLDPRESSRGSTIASPLVLEIQEELRSSNPEALARSKFQVCHRLGYKRKHFVLLEVLIAFAFVLIGILPLIYPHFYIYQQQRKFIEKIDLDIAVNEFYALIIEQLHQNQIPWGTIELKQPMPITGQFWAQATQYKTPPFTGNYQFQIVKSKKNENYGLYLLKLTVTIPPKTFKTEAEKIKKTLTYTYEIFATRLFSTS